ncbi:MAG: ABC transporter permease [Alkalispirochaeta sp.]
MGMLTGIIAAIKQFGWQDALFTFVVLIGISTPSFWLGLMFVLAFSLNLGWFPVSGMTAVVGGGRVLDVVHHLVLPAVTLAVVATGVIARLTRSTMLEVLRRDFVRSARAKGLPERTVIIKHAYKNALVNIIPVLGIQAGFVIGGAVYIETVFQWPGIGRMLVNAILTRDVLLVQGGVVVVAAIYVLINLTADVFQHLLDPRISV